MLAAAGARLGLVTAFDWAAPFLLLGGPLAAVLINLRGPGPPAHSLGRRGGALTAINFRFDPANLFIVLAAGASAKILAAYMVSEAIGHMIRAAH